MSLRLPDDVLVKAETLRRNTQQDREIQEIVMDIVKNCNEEIHKQHQKGKREVIMALPYTFNIPDMTNADSQRRVWATVVQIMINAGYDTQIEFDSSQCRLHCNWLSQKDKSDITLWDSLLRKHRFSGEGAKKKSK